MNEYGLDARYFKEKLGQLVRDADNYTPVEMVRALGMLKDVAQSQTRKAVAEREGKVKLTQAMPADIVLGATVYIFGDNKEFNKMIIDEVLRPADLFKGFVADDGCRYGLDDCYVGDTQ